MNNTSLANLYKLYRIPGFLESLDDVFLTKLLTLLVQAGAFAQSFRQLMDLGVNLKGDEDFITVVDVKNQDYLVAQLLTANIEHLLEGPLPTKIGFVLEEDTDITKQNIAKGDEDIFVYIDPIDGTTSFKDGGDDFAIGVSIQSSSGNLFYSAIYIPAREEIVVADRNHDQGYYFDAQGTKHHISTQERESGLELKRIAAHYNPAHKDTLLQVYSLLAEREVLWHSDVTNQAERYGDNPVPGSLMIDLLDLAHDKYDLVINGGCHLWDVAPVEHLLAKAGYMLVDWSGNPISTSSFKGKDQLLKVVAGKQAAVETFFEKIRSSGMVFE